MTTGRDDDHNDQRRLLQLRQQQASPHWGDTIPIEPRHGYNESYVALIDRVQQAEREQTQSEMRATTAEAVIRLLLKEGTLDEEIFQRIVQYSAQPHLLYLSMALRMTEKKL